jgi:hypothetical protein
MNKQEAVELFATFLFESNLNRPINNIELAEERKAKINTPEMKEFFVGEATNFYEFLDDNGLIVKP